MARQQLRRGLGPITYQLFLVDDWQVHAVFDDTITAVSLGKGMEPLIGVCGLDLALLQTMPVGSLKVCLSCLKRLPADAVQAPWAELP